MDNENNRPLLISLIVGFLVFLGAGGFYFLRTGAFATPMIPIVFGVIVLLGIIVIGAATWRVWQQSSGEKAKPKREMDMYEIIDRLVDDLNEDEANYLWRKLNTADRQATADSLTSLLEEREQQKS